MSDFYSYFFRNALFPAWEGVVRHRPTLRHLADLERSQWLGLDALKARQGRELGKLVNHAYANVPYYHRQLTQLGVHPSAIRSPEDLAQLPVMTRDLATGSYPDRRSTSPPLAEITKQTSGSTGQPLAFGYDLGSEHWRQAVKLRGYAWAGYRPGDKALHYWGMLDLVYPKSHAARAKAQIDHLLRRDIYADCTDRSPERLDEVVGLIRDQRPDVLVCYTQAAVALARHVVETGTRSWGTIPVVCGAEPLLPGDRDLLEQAFGPRVFLTYGSRECMLIAAECEAHQGMHVSMENLIVEVLVREGDDYRSARPGETGEVAITDLHNYGAPFIRYLNGDLAVRGDDAPCTCGRALLRLDSIEGRVNDTLRDGRGNPVSGMFFAVLFSVLANEVRQFQAIQAASGALVVKLVPGPQFSSAIERHVQESCRRALPGVEVATEVVETIAPGKNGKHRFVVVERPSIAA